jgi:hypothetical protein
MYKIAAALFSSFVLSVVAVPNASAAPQSGKNLVGLQRQVRALQKQVRALNARVKSLESYSGAPFLGATCQAALTADLFQGTWAVIDQVAGRTIFGPQTQLNDYGNCAYMRSPLVPRPPVQVPPSIAIFNPLIDWLHLPLN